MDSYLKPDEKIEKYEKIHEEQEQKQSEEAAKLRKKKRRIRAKNFKPGRILLHVTHTKDGQKRKSLDFKNKCVILWQLQVRMSLVEVIFRDVSRISLENLFLRFHIEWCCNGHIYIWSNLND